MVLIVLLGFMTFGALVENMELSNRRADAVKNYLINTGISASIMTAKAFVETILINSNDTE
jgi:OOP family OmpA-OmpF porin